MKVKRSVKRWALAGLAAVTVSMALLGGAVFAQDNQPSESVTTTANVTSQGVPAIIECAWELPDMVSSSTDATIQYDTTPGAHQHDADMNLKPDASSTQAGVQIPCDLPSSGTSTYPAQPDGVHSMIQVWPNAANSPEEKRVQLWTAVDHPNGVGAISDVYWKVFHPDGSFKVQVHANSQYNGGIVSASNNNCTDFGNATTADTMFEAAVGTGQISTAAIDDTNNGLIALCQEGSKAFYYAQFQISKDQPCGEYRIETHAVAGGTDVSKTTFIDVECFYNLNTDFNTVNFGSLLPGVDQTVAGDLDMSTPGRPTVMNTGNVGMYIGLNFSSLVQQTDGSGNSVVGGKTIDSFDGAFGLDPSTLQKYATIGTGVNKWFQSTDNQLVCSDQIGKLDLSVHPPTTLPQGQYDGSLLVLAKSAGGNSDQFGEESAHYALPQDGQPATWHTCLQRFHTQFDPTNPNFTQYGTFSIY